MGRRKQTVMDPIEEINARLDRLEATSPHKKPAAPSNASSNAPEPAPAEEPAPPAAAPQLPPLFAQSFEMLVAQQPDKEVLVFDGPLTTSRGVAPAIFTLSQLNSRTNRLVRSLREEYGVGNGDCVVTVCDNRPEMFTLMLACLKIGATLVPLATDLMTVHEHGLTSNYSPKLVVCGFPGRDYPNPAGGGWPLITLPEYYSHEGAEWDVMETEGDDSNPGITATYKDTSLIFSTSGSTGVPKGVMYDGVFLAIHGVIVKMMAAKGLKLLPDSLPEGRSNSQLLWVPMRGVGGTSITLMLLAEGVSSIMCDTPTAGPVDWGPLCERYKITSLLLFGAAMNRFISEMPDNSYPDVLKITYGGNCFPPTLIQQSMEQFPNASWTQGYAMTECLMMSSMPNECHLRANQCNERDFMVMRSAGKPSPGLSEVFIEPIDNPLSGESVASIPDDSERWEKMGRKPGEGQICAKTKFMMIGYYGDAEKTLETGVTAAHDGFMRTGDIGRFDEDGFLYVIDRMKDIINAYKGYSIDPRDIEEVLYSHPKVGQAACVGIPHECGAGELITAWVVPKEGQTLTRDEVREHCQVLAEFQQPNTFEISYKKLPEVGGKISKKLIRSASWVRAGLGDRLDVSLKKAMQLDRNSTQEVIEARVYFERMDFDGSDGILQSDEWAFALGAIPEVQRKGILATLGSALGSYELETFGAVQKPFGAAVRD